MYKPLTEGDIRWIEESTERAFTTEMSQQAHIKQLERESERLLENLHKQKNNI
jgi:uncharacterized protein with von Willebrand factor type A (vWA) domain